MITIFLYGVLADNFGPKHRLAVKSPAEAVKALECLNPGKFYEKFKDLSLEVVRGSEFVGEETLKMESDSDIHFTPVVEGSKSGAMQAIMGAVIIVAAVATAGAAAGAAYGLAEGIAAGSMASTTFLGVSMQSYALFGASMLFGGISQMLTPTPSLSSGLGSSADPNESFVFTGAANNVSQGGCVPVIYGLEVEVGSTFISQSLMVEDV